MTISTIPVILEEEASRRVANLNMRRELEVMLDWVRQNVPDLQGIRVANGVSRNPHLANLVFIHAHRSAASSNAETDLIDWDFICWKSQRFPIPICTNVCCCSRYHPLETP
jgi:hypothetical protein